MPRSVAVEGQPEPLREPAELLQLLLGEGGAHARDDGLEPRLAKRDHVGVALDDTRAILPCDRGARLVEAVHDPTLVEELRLGCVDVLGLEWIVVMELTSLKAEHPALP